MLLAETGEGDGDNDGDLEDEPETDVNDAGEAFESSSASNARVAAASKRLSGVPGSGSTQAQTPSQSQSTAPPEFGLAVMGIPMSQRRGEMAGQAGKNGKGQLVDRPAPKTKTSKEVKEQKEKNEAEHKQ